MYILKKYIGFAFIVLKVFYEQFFKKSVGSIENMLFKAITIWWSQCMSGQSVTVLVSVFPLDHVDERVTLDFSYSLAHPQPLGKGWNNTNVPQQKQICFGK